MPTVLISGANRGLGLETARQMGRDHGFAVLLGARDQDRGEAAAALLRGEGLDARAVVLDVRDVASIERAIASIQSLDVLINNAGVMIEHDARVIDVPFETWRATFEVNLLGAVALTQACWSLLEASSAPRVVNVSAILGSLSEISKPSMKTWIRASYSASKAALNAFTVALAQENGGPKWKINAAHPGWAKTDMGGPQAPMTPAQGARSIVSLATLGEDGPTGGFFHMGKSMNW